MPGPPLPPPPRLLLLAAALLLTLSLQGSTAAENAEGSLSAFEKVNNTTSASPTTTVLRTLWEAPAASEDLQNNAPKNTTPSSSLPSSTPSANVTKTTRKRKRPPRIRLIKVYKKVWRNPKRKNRPLDTNSGNEMKPSNSNLPGNQTSSVGLAELLVKPESGGIKDEESTSQLPHTPTRIRVSSEDNKSRDENENQRKGEQSLLPVPPINSEDKKEKFHFDNEPLLKTTRPPSDSKQKILVLPSQTHGNDEVETTEPLISMSNEDSKPRTLNDFELATQENIVEEQTVISRLSKPIFQIDEHTESDVAARFPDVQSDKIESLNQNPPNSEIQQENTRNKSYEYYINGTINVPDRDGYQRNVLGVNKRQDDNCTTDANTRHPTESALDTQPCVYEFTSTDSKQTSQTRAQAINEYLNDDVSKSFVNISTKEITSGNSTDFDITTEFSYESVIKEEIENRRLSILADEISTNEQNEDVISEANNTDNDGYQRDISEIDISVHDDSTTETVISFSPTSVVDSQHKYDSIPKDTTNQQYYVDDTPIGDYPNASSVENPAMMESTSEYSSDSGNRTVFNSKDTMEEELEDRQLSILENNEFNRKQQDVITEANNNANNDGYQHVYMPNVDSPIHDDPTTQIGTPHSPASAKGVKHEYESIPTDTAYQRHYVNSNSTVEHPNASSYELSTNPSMKESTSETRTESDNTTEPHSKDKINNLIENRILPILTDNEGVRKQNANSMNEEKTLIEDSSTTEPNNLYSTNIVTSLHSAYEAIPKVSISKQDSPRNPLFINEYSRMRNPEASPNVLLSENSSLDNRSFSDSDLITDFSSEENESELPSISDSETNKNEHNNGYYEAKNSPENGRFQSEIPNENTLTQNNTAKDKYSLDSFEIFPDISSENEFLSKYAPTQSNFLNNSLSTGENSSALVSETNISLPMNESNSSENRRLIYSDNITYEDNVSSEEDDTDIIETSFVPHNTENLETSVIKGKNPENYGHQRGMPEVTTPLHEINSIRNLQVLPSLRNKSENTSGEHETILEETFSVGLSQPEAHSIDKISSPVTSLSPTSEDSKRSTNRKHAKIESVSDLSSEMSLYVFKNREFSAIANRKPNGNEEGTNVPSSKTFSETMFTDISKTPVSSPEESTEPISFSYVVTQQPSEQTEQRDNNFPPAREFYQSSETSPETSSKKPSVEFDKSEVKDYNTPDMKIKVMKLMLQNCHTPNNTKSQAVKQNNRIYTKQKDLPKVRKIVRDEIKRILSSMAPTNKNVYRSVLRTPSFNNRREKYKQTNHENNKQPPLNYFAKKELERTDSLTHPTSMNSVSGRSVPRPATLHSPGKKMPEPNEFTRICPLENHSRRLKPREGSKPNHRVISSYYNQPIRPPVKHSGSLNVQHKTGSSKTDGMKSFSLASLTKQFSFKIPPLSLKPPSAIPLSLPAYFVEDGVPDSDSEVLIEKIENKPHNIDHNDYDDKDYMSLQNLNRQRMIEAFWPRSLATTAQPQRKGQIGVRTYLGQSEVIPASTFANHYSMKTVLSPACTSDSISGRNPSPVPVPIPASIHKHFPAPLNKHNLFPFPTPNPTFFPASVLDPIPALDTGPVQDSFPTPIVYSFLDRVLSPMSDFFPDPQPDLDHFLNSNNAPDPVPFPISFQDPITGPSPILDSMLAPASALGLASFPVHVPGPITILVPGLALDPPSILLYSVLAPVVAPVPASFSVPTLDPIFGSFSAPIPEPNLAPALASVPSPILAPILAPLTAPNLHSIIASAFAPLPTPILDPFPAPIFDPILDSLLAPIIDPIDARALASDPAFVRAPTLGSLPSPFLAPILAPASAPLPAPILAPILAPVPAPIAPAPFDPLLVSLFHCNVVPRPEPFSVTVSSVVPAPALVPNYVSAPVDLAFSKEMRRGLWTDEGRPLHFYYQGETPLNQFNIPYSDATPTPYSSWSASSPPPLPPSTPPLPSTSPSSRPSSPPPPPTPLAPLSPSSPPMLQSAPRLPLSFSPPRPLRWPWSSSLLPPLPEAKRQQVAVNLCVQSLRIWYARINSPPTLRPYPLALRYS